MAMEGRQYASVSEAQTSEEFSHSQPTGNDVENPARTGGTSIESPTQVGERVVNLHNRPYLLKEFPNYDYRNPTHPWRMDYRFSQNRPLVAQQLQAFHYWWAFNQAKLEGPSYSLLTPDLPYATLIDPYDNIYNSQYQNEEAAIIICSAVLPLLPCYSNKPKCAEQVCLHMFLYRCISLLREGGVLIGFIFDEQRANDAGGSFREIRSWKSEASISVNPSNFIHSWSTAGFLKILTSLIGDIPHCSLEEYDTLRNYFACNFVIRKDQQWIPQ